MGASKTVGWSVVSAIAVIAVAFQVDQPPLRAVLSVLAATPLLYAAISSVMSAKRIADRREYVDLRQATEEFLRSVRDLNSLKVIAQEDTELSEAEEMIDVVVSQMHRLVDRIRSVAGHSGRVAGDEQGRAEPQPARR